MTLQYQDALGLAQAHSLAIEKIPGLRVARVKMWRQDDLFPTDLYVCVGHCHKCDGYWRVFRTEPTLNIEVVHVGFAEPATPA